MALAWGAAGWTAMTIALATTVAPATTGCTTHQCDPKQPLTWATGDWIDGNTWETSDIDGPWMPFDGNSTVTITWSHPDGRRPFDVEPYVGISEDGGDNPNGDNDGGSNFINAAGSLVEYITWNKDDVVILNSTCASYLARFIVRFPPRESDAATVATAH